MSEAIGASLWRWLPGLQLLRAYSWAEAVAVLNGAHYPPVFIITDLQLPDSPPTKTLQSLRQLHEQVPVLALTMLEDLSTLALCERYQVLYLCKTAAADHLRQTLQDWLGREQWQKWSAQPSVRLQPFQILTTRQLDILRELANGRSNREVTGWAQTRTRKATTAKAPTLRQRP